MRSRDDDDVIVPLNLDLTSLPSAPHFEQLCFRLARECHPRAMPFGASWDGGRDVTVFYRPGESDGDIVYQCKFFRDPTRNKAKIVESLDRLAENERPVAEWILCLPVDPSGAFTNWLFSELEARVVKGSVWGRSEILARLEKRPDLVETYFFSVWADLAQYFRIDRLELFRLGLDPACQWRESPKPSLRFVRSENVVSPDLVLDVLVRNVGTISTAITSLVAEVFDWNLKAHGLPGDGLLFPQITYKISIGGGKPGEYRQECEPPLLVKAGDMERFKIRVTDAGYSWNGGLRVGFIAGDSEPLWLPAMRLWT